MHIVEQWRPVLGWEGLYEVSNHGCVRSLDRIITDMDGRRTRKLRGTLLKPNFVDGYPCVRLCSQERGNKLRKVHIIVLESFVGPRPRGHLTRHLNDVRSDCRLVNLKWGTGSENGRDAVRNSKHAGANKDQCPQGHRYTPENTYCRPGTNFRECRTCRRMRRRNHAIPTA